MGIGHSDQSDNLFTVISIQIIDLVLQGGILLRVSIFKSSLQQVFQNIHYVLKNVTLRWRKDEVS